MELVERRRDPGDGRRVLVTPTARGKALRQAAADVPARILSRFGLDVDAARALRDDLTRLVHTLEGPSATRTDTDTAEPPR